MHALELNALCRRYGDLYAVNQLDLSVPAGSIYGFLGPNGAGKTTTLRRIPGLLRPTSGEIRLNGLPVSFGLATGRERIGYLPDVPTFYPWMTPQEYLRFSGSLYGIPHRDLERRIAESLDLVGLQKAKRRIGGYSRGMKQRLGIAQALLHTPSLVLLDEPASALDPIGRKDVMDIIRNLAGTTTVFFSTHILSDIERVCDRVAILDKGRLVLEDGIAALKQKVAPDAWRIRLETPLQATRLADLLQTQQWVVGTIDRGDCVLKVSVSDLHQGALSIPRITAGEGYPLYAMEPVAPTLEDIFLHAISPDGVAKEDRKGAPS